MYKKRVLLNASNALGAGAKIVIKNIISSMPSAAEDVMFVAILPDIDAYHSLPEYNNLQIVFIKQHRFRLIHRYLDLKYNIAKWVKLYNIDTCFTLGDIGPLRLKVPHFVLLHQAYILDKEYAYHGKLSLVAKIHFIFVRRHFRNMAPSISGFFVQTPKMAKGLKKYYKTPKSKVFFIPQALPSHILSPRNTDKYKNIFINKGNDKIFYFLFLAAGYEHKNHKVLPGMIQQLKILGIKNFKVIITLNNTNSSYEKKILHLLKNYKENIIDVGRVNPDDVPSLFRHCDALFMPSTLESFGLIYLESMAFKKPILTSDRDFSRWVCGSGALYFEPNDSLSIANCIKQFIINGPPYGYEKEFDSKLEQFPKTWDTVSRIYLEKMINSSFN